MLRESIMNGQIQPIQKLVVGEIADSLGVSRTPVREAFQHLCVEGFITIRRGKGAFVNRISTEEIEEIYSIRGALEGLSAARATKRMTKDHLKSLGAMILAPDLTKGEELSKVLKQGRDFHGLVAEIAASPILSGILSDLQARLTRFEVENAINPSRRETVLEEHEAIMRAFESGDANLAREVMVEHVIHSLDFVLSQLKHTDSPHT